MRKLLGFLAFFFIGIGVSYFFANHSIVERKKDLKSEIELLASQYNATELSFEELQRQNQELNGKIFQLLFAYFGIDLRGLELESINQAREISKIKIETIEKVVYVDKEIPREEKKEKKKSKKLSMLDVNDFIKDARPVQAKNKSFEALSKKYKLLKTKEFNEKSDLLKFDLDYKMTNKQYVGEFKVSYTKLNKDAAIQTNIGSPTSFIVNKSYPNMIGVWIQSNLIAIVNTRNGFNERSLKGMVFKLGQHGQVKREEKLYYSPFQ